MIHFILSQGALTWQYERAIKTAEIHGKEIVLWYAGDKAPQPVDSWLLVSIEPINVPGWLLERNFPAAYIYDWLAIKTLVEHGGAVIGLDTVSVKPMMDLLGDKDICVSSDVPMKDYFTQSRPIDHPFNNNYIGKKGSNIAWRLYMECTQRLKSGQVWLDKNTVRPLQWGDTGPGLLTRLILDNPEVAKYADFPEMTGWEGSYIWKYYCGLEEPQENVCLIHLFSSAYRTLYSGTPTAVEQWVTENPGFEWVLPNKMPEILKKESWE